MWRSAFRLRVGQQGTTPGKLLCYSMDIQSMVASSWREDIRCIGSDERTERLFSYVRSEARVRAAHPLRPDSGDYGRATGRSVGRVRGDVRAGGSAIDRAGEATDWEASDAPHHESAWPDGLGEPGVRGCCRPSQPLPRPGRRVPRSRHLRPATCQRSRRRRPQRVC